MLIRDALSSLVRSAVKVPKKRLGLLAKIAKDLVAENVYGKEFYDNYLNARTKAVRKFVIKRNENGHVVVNIQGVELTGAEEIENFEENTICFRELVRECFLSAIYNAEHCLIHGWSYEVAFVQGNEIANPSRRTINNLRNLGEKYGYGRPVAGFVPRIIEEMGNDPVLMKEFENVYCLHEPIPIIVSGFPREFSLCINNGSIYAKNLTKTNLLIDGSILFMFPIVDKMFEG